MGYHYHLTPALRLVRVVALSLLLVGVQHGALLHALEHDGEALRHAQGKSFSVPDDEVCAICALFAGGANALSDHAEPAAAVFFGEEDPPYAPTPIVAAAPNFYESRAPPVFL